MGIRLLGEALFRLYQDFPQPIGQLKLIAAGGTFEARFVSDQPLPFQVYARYCPSEQAFLLNPYWFGNTPRFHTRLAKEEELGFRPKGCVQANSVVAHELGHIIWTWLLNQRNTRSQLKRWLAAHPPNRSLSLYGEFSTEEMWAEGVAAQYYGTSQAKQHPYVQAQWQFLEAFLGEQM